MYCKHCGKELADTAFMCPSCGCPTSEKSFGRNVQGKVMTAESPKAQSSTALSVIGFVFSAIAIVTGIIFGSFLFVFSLSELLVFVLGSTTILPALAAIAIGIYGLFCFDAQELRLARALSIAGIVLAGTALLFLFIGGCVIVATY